MFGYFNILLPSVALMNICLDKTLSKTIQEKLEIVYMLLQNTIGLIYPGSLLSAKDL